MGRFGSAAIFFLTFLLFAIEADAYASLEIQQVDPSSPNTCVVKDAKGVNERHPVGSTWQNGKCEELSCIKRDDKLYLSLTGCGVAEVPPPCKMLPINFAKPYPECCPKPRCPDDK